MKKLIGCLIFSSFIASNVYADNIAIIGGGAAGLTTAWLLEQNHNVTLYEAKDHLGGNAETVKVMINHKPVYIDAGAEFLTIKSYPHFFKLLDSLKISVETHDPVITFYRTDNSDFIMLPPIHNGQIVWESLTPTNLERSVWLLSFINNGYSIYTDKNMNVNLEEFITNLKVPENVRNEFLYPFLSGYWGASVGDIKVRPAYGPLLYLEQAKENNNKTYEVVDGLTSYINAEKNSLQNTDVKLNAEVTQIKPTDAGYTITTKDGNEKYFDHLIIATHAETASKILKDISGETNVVNALNKITYYDTTIAIHGDKRFMPEKDKYWSYLNIHFDGKLAELTVYKPSSLPDMPVLKSWISANDPMPSPLYGLFHYRHPVYDKNFFEVAKDIAPLQGQNHIWLAGGWVAGEDSQEGAIDSAINLAKVLSPDSPRLHALTD